MRLEHSASQFDLYWTVQPQTSRGSHAGHNVLYNNMLKGNWWVWDVLLMNYCIIKPYLNFNMKCVEVE